jgi:Fe-S cluster biogenesis protein NfuA
MAGADDVRATGQRVEALLADLGRLGDGSIAAVAEDLVRALVRLYGAGLDRVMEILTETGAAEALHRLTADDLVSGLLLVHDLHPLTTAERVRRALDGVRPSLGGDDVELLGVTGGVVRLRLTAAGHGCGAAAVTRTLERAVFAAAPELSGVAVERTGPLVQIGPRPPGPVPGGPRR